MGRLKFDRERVPSLRPDQWARLAAPFGEANREFMAHEVANYAGTNRVQARALMTALVSDGFAEMMLLVYHDCNSATFVHERPLVEGPPVLPWECPECGEEVEHEHELRYDLLCVLKGPVEF